MMKKHDAGPGPVPRRGFLRNLVLTVLGAFGLTALNERPSAGPEEKDLREADFYKKHDLAG